MGGCHIWCKHKEIKTYRCYFLCSVVLQYIFFYFCCLNERNIVVLIFHHQRPLDFLPLCVKQVDAAYFFFCSSFVPSQWFFACCFLHTHPLTDPRSVTAVSVSCFCGPHRNKRWGWGADAKVASVGFVYRSKDAALRCRDHGCNIKTDGSIHDGATASAVWTLQPKFLICRKVGHQSSLTSALLQSPKKMPVALIFPSLAIARLFNLCTLCAYDH